MSDASDAFPSTLVVSGGRFRRIFVGSDGIRAGWSLLIFGVLITLFTLLGALAAKFVFHGNLNVPKGEITPAFLLSSELPTVALTLGVTAIMRRIEGRSFWSYGLSGPRKLANFAAGWLGGLACLSMLVAGLWLGGFLVFDGVALHGSPALAYALIWLFIFFLVGLGEECLFRGYVQYTLARGIGFWPAALVISLLFGAAHLKNPGEDAAGIAGVVAAGLVFCLLLRVSGSLWLGIGFHTSWDWAQSYLYGTPDSGMMMRGHLLLTHAAGAPRISGGTAGPEGSLLGIPVLIAGLLVMVVTLRQTGLFGARSAK